MEHAHDAKNTLKQRHKKKYMQKLNDNMCFTHTEKQDHIALGGIFLKLCWKVL